jgi:arginyl-tRNA synthetase
MSGRIPTLATHLGEAVSAAVVRQFPDLADADPLVRRSEHADFQSDAALGMARRAGQPPRAVAERLAPAVTAAAGALLDRVDVSGPGFLNLTVTDPALWQRVEARLASPRLGIGRPQAGRRTVVDYSAVNIAKQMHVGHLRTTVIGDCLVRVLGFLGAQVTRQNHLGDWGTQFGMLIQYLDEHPDAAWHRGELTGGESPVSALDTLYRAARVTFEADPAFADRARARVVALQSGDEATLARWREIVTESEAAFGEIYRRLGAQLSADDSAGESFYNPMLADVAAELSAAGIAVVSDGALCVFAGDSTVPLIVRKRDGGYGYDATDLATIRYRVRELRADRILYVVDARQALHFRLVFATARAVGWLTDGIEATHVAFGTVLGTDGRPFRTRSGDTIALTDVLDAAVERARTVTAEKNPDLSPAELTTVAEQAGIGAVKYADLATSRTKDYVFDVDRMVSFAGNTGVYLQFAHTRMRSILRKAGDDTTARVDVTLPLHPTERALALSLDGFGDALTEVASTLEPHRLCGYLYALARAFTDFYESVPVLAAPDDGTRGNRLALCALAAATLARGLDLLGIAAPERM